MGRLPSNLIMRPSNHVIALIKGEGQNGVQAGLHEDAKAEKQPSMEEKNTAGGSGQNGGECVWVFNDSVRKGSPLQGQAFSL